MPIEFNRFKELKVDLPNQPAPAPPRQIEWHNPPNEVVNPVERAFAEVNLNRDLLLGVKGAAEIKVPSEKWQTLKCGLTIRIDQKNNTLHVFQPSQNGRSYVETKTNREGRSSTSFYHAIVASYKVNQTNRFNDGDLLQKLNALDYSSSEVEKVLIRYLGLKPVELPSPKKAPLLYSHVPAQPSDLFKAVCALDGKLTVEDVEKIHHRSLYFNEMRRNGPTPVLTALGDLAIEKGWLTPEDITHLASVCRAFDAAVAGGRQVELKEVHLENAARNIADVALPIAVEKKVQKEKEVVHEEPPLEVGGFVPAEERQLDENRVAKLLQSPDTFLEGLRYLKDFESDIHLLLHIPAPRDPRWLEILKLDEEQKQKIGFELAELYSKLVNLNIDPTDAMHVSEQRMAGMLLVHGITRLHNPHFVANNLVKAFLLYFESNGNVAHPQMHKVIEELKGYGIGEGGEPEIPPPVNIPDEVRNMIVEELAAVPEFAARALNFWNQGKKKIYIDQSIEELCAKAERVAKPFVDSIERLGEKNQQLKQLKQQIIEELTEGMDFREKRQVENELTNFLDKLERNKTGIEPQFQKVEGHLKEYQRLIQERREVFKDMEKERGLAGPIFNMVYIYESHENPLHQFRSTVLKEILRELRMKSAYNDEFEFDSIWKRAVEKSAKKGRAALKVQLKQDQIDQPEEDLNRLFQALDEKLGGDPVFVPMKAFEENPSSQSLAKFILCTRPLNEPHLEMPIPLGRIYQKWITLNPEGHFTEGRLFQMMNKHWSFGKLEMQDFEKDPQLVPKKLVPYKYIMPGRLELDSLMNRHNDFENILFNEISIGPVKQAERGLQFIFENPAWLKNHVYMYRLHGRIFGQGQIDGLIQLEHEGRNQYLSKVVPKALTQTFAALAELLIDPMKTEEEKGHIVLAQGRLLMIGMRIHNYLTSYNALNPDSPIDTAGYQNLKDQFIALCVNHRLGMPERKLLAKEYLKAEYLKKNQEPTVAQWDLAAVANQALWKSATEPQVASFYLKKQMDLLWGDQPKPTLSLHIDENGRLAAQFENKEKHFKATTHPVKRKKKPDQWNLEKDVLIHRELFERDEKKEFEVPMRLIETVKKVFGQNLTLLPKEKEEGKVRIVGTDFTYNDAGDLFWKGCKYVENVPAAIAFTKDLGNCFYNEGARGYWIVKEGKPLYYYSTVNECIRRSRDDAIAYTKDVEEGLVWHHSKNGAWEAFSVQNVHTAPYREMRIAGNHLISELHPGYLAAKENLKINQVDFSLKPNVDGIWLQNDHGDHLLEMNLFGQEVELHYSQGRFTGKPWEQLAIALQLKDPIAIQQLTQDLQLSPPSSQFQKDVAQALGEIVANGPFHPMGMWMQLAMIEVGILGEQSKFMNVKSDKMQEILFNYQQYQSFPLVKASKETERQFLVACNRWFNTKQTVGEEVGLIKKIINFLKRQAQDPKAREANSVRALYRILAEPVIRAQEAELIHGKTAKRQFHQMAVVDLTGLMGVFNLPLLKMPMDLKQKDFLEDFRIAKEGSKDEKQKLVERLELKRVLSQNDSWLLDVAAKPNYYPTYATVVKLFDELENSGKGRTAILNLFKPKGVLALRLIMMATKQLFSFIGTMIGMSKWVKPLKLSNTPFAKAFFKVKTKFQGDKESIKTPLKHADEVFDAYFLSMNQLLLEVKPKADDRPQYHLEGKDQKVKDYRAATPLVDIALKADKLDEAIQSIEEQSRVLQETLKVREQALLLQANTSQDDVAYVHRKALGRGLTWEELISLVYKQQLNAYEKHLSQADQASAVESGVYSYLAIRARVHQMHRVKKALKALADHPDDAESLRALHEQLSATRGYKGENPIDRLLLFYEAASPKGLFKHEQVAKINEIGGKKVALAEMPTGYGKTDYIIPMINEWIREADQGEKPKKGKVQKVERTVSKLKRMVLNIWPGPLVSVNSQAIRQKSSDAKGGRSFEMHFTREMGFDPLQLEKLLLDLETASQKGIPVSARSEDVAALHLHFTETLERLLQGSQEPSDRERLVLFQEILRIFHGTTVGRIDEAREVLDPMQRTIYTVGRPIPCPELAVDFATEMYELLSRKRGDQDSPFVRAIQSPRTLTVDEVENHLKEIFDDHTLNDLAQLVGMNPPQFQQFLKGDLNVPEGAPDPQKAYLAKGYYFGIVKSVIAGAVDVQYGLSKAHFDRFKFAIPYEKKDMPRESKNNDSPSVYSSVDETLFKTLRIYHARGLEREDMVDLFAKLVLEYRETRDAAILEVIKDFRAQFGIDEDKYFKIMEVLPQDPKCLIRAAIPQDLAINKENKWVAHFVKFVVAPGLTRYPSSVWFTPQDLALTLGESLSLSATPQMPETHSMRTEFVEMKGAEGKLYDLLMTKIRNIQPIPEANAFIESLNQACRVQNVCAVADPSGLMRFDQSFVREIAENFGQDHPIKHIVYFDKDQDKFVRYSIESDMVQPFEAATHAECLEETLTLYDMARSTGSDILQRQTGVEILLTSPATSVMQAGQGAGRMRKLDKGQSLIVWNQGQENTVQALVELWAKNEADNSRTKNFNAIHQLMDAEVRIAMMRKLIGLPVEADQRLQKRVKVDAKENVARTLELYQKYRSQLLRDEAYDPQAQYGALGKMLTGQESLALQQKAQQQLAKETFSPKESKKVIAALDKYEEAWKRLQLPKLVPGVRLGEAQEMQQEQEQEQEQEIEVNRNLPKFQWKKAKEWPSLNEFQGRQFEREMKMARVFKQFRKINEQIEALKKQKNNKEAAKRKIESLQKRRLKLAESIEKRQNKKRRIEFKQVNSLLDLGLPENLRNASRLFTDNFMVSENLLSSVQAVELALVNVEKRMPLHRVLLIAEMKNKVPVLKAIALNSEDEIDLVKMMNEAQKQDGLKRQLAIYDLSTDAIVDRSKEFALGLSDSDQAQALIAQAKLLGGHTSYTPKQRSILLENAEKIVPGKAAGQMIAKFLFAVTPASKRKPYFEYEGLFKR